jgi:hypothetical protein
MIRARLALTEYWFGRGMPDQVVTEPDVAVTKKSMLFEHPVKIRDANSDVISAHRQTGPSTARFHVRLDNITEATPKQRDSLDSPRKINPTFAVGLDLGDTRMQGVLVHPRHIFKLPAFKISSWFIA